MNIPSCDIVAQTMTFGNIDKLHQSEYEIEVNWKIKDFLQYVKSSFTEVSPPFTWSSIDWTIQMEYSSEKEVRLFLHKCKSEMGRQVMFKFGIRLIDEAVEMRCNLTKSFECPVEGFGTQEFILKSELVERKHELLPGGDLTISCSIASFGSVNKPHNIKYERLDVLSSDLKKLHESHKNSDITIIVEGQRFPAHTIILASRSDIFAAELEQETAISSRTIVVSDCDSKSFDDFLLFLYTGRVENLSSNVCQLYNTADKYNVKDLKSLCLKYMERNVSETNFCAIATLANHFNETGLMAVIQEFFNLNTLKVVNGSAWEQLTKQNFALANELLTTMLKNARNAV